MSAITWDNLDQKVAELSANREREAEAQYLASHPESQALEDQTLNLALLKGMASFGNPLATGTKRIATSGLAGRAVNANKGSGLSYNSELGDIARLAMKNNAAFGKKATAIADVKRPSLLRNIDAENAALAHERMNAAAMYERAKAAEKAKYVQAGQDSLQGIFGAK